MILERKFLAKISHDLFSFNCVKWCVTFEFMVEVTTKPTISDL